MNGVPISPVTPLQAPEERCDETSPERNLIPAERSSLTQTLPLAAKFDDIRDQRTTPQQPNTKRSFSSFLRDVVDPIDPDPPPESDLHTFVSEWLGSVGPDGKRRRSSDSDLHHSDDSSLSRRRAHSEPRMGNAHDADGFTVPPTPTSDISGSDQAGRVTGSVEPSVITGVTDSVGLSAKSLVNDHLYREANLAENHVYMLSSAEKLPDHIASLVNQIGQDRDSPGPSLNDVRQDSALECLALGAPETEVETYFKDNIFPRPKPTEIMKRSDKQQILKHAIPKTESKLRLSGPIPDVLYGYNRQQAFNEGHRALFTDMKNFMVVNTQNLTYPFLLVEFKGDSPGAPGSLWAATNQCLGGSASCVKIAEGVNHQLVLCRSKDVQRVENSVFSIAMSGTEARLYVSWKHDEKTYYTRTVEYFLLQRPDHYLEFRKYVLNIIDWGKGSRLDKIQAALDAILEANKKKASLGTKSCSPSLAGSVTSNDKKRKRS